MYIKPWITLGGLAAVLGLGGCQTLSNTTEKVSDQVTGLFSAKDKAPKIDKDGVVDISKKTLEQLEKFTASMPTQQWVYIENEQLGRYQLKNKAQDGVILTLALHCKISSQRPTFSLSNAEGKPLLKAYDPNAGQIQFLLDNQNYGNPFNVHTDELLKRFQAAIAQAKVIKIFNASRLYTFQNGNADLLSKPVSCQESGASG